MFIRCLGGHTGDQDVRVDAEWEVPEDTQYIYHSGYQKNIDSIAWNGIVPGGLHNESGRHDVFLSVLGPSQRGNREPFRTLERFVPVVYRHKHADAIYRVDHVHARSFGLKFFQNPSGAVLCHGTALP